MSTDHQLPASHRQDLRQHPRFPLEDVGIKLTKPGLLTSLGVGSNKAKAAVNLSEGGILVLAGERFVEGAKVSVKLDVDKFDDHFLSEGVVRWCGQAARGANDFYVGIQFKGLPTDDRKKIARMRAWFTSPEFKVRSSTRRKLASS